MKTWPQYAKELWGPSWGVCRATEKNKARYARCLTKLEYSNGERRFWEDRHKEQNGEILKLQERIELLESEFGVDTIEVELNGKISTLENTIKVLEESIIDLKDELEDKQKEIEDTESIDEYSEDISRALNYTRLGFKEQKWLQEALIILERLPI